MGYNDENIELLLSNSGNINTYYKILVKAYTGNEIYIDGTKYESGSSVTRSYSSVTTICVFD